MAADRLQETKIKVEHAIGRLENLISALSLPLSDEIHVECLRAKLPEVLADFKKAVR